MNWSLFADIATQIEDPLLKAVSGVSDTLISGVAGPFRAAMILYVAMVGLMIMSGRMTEPLRDTWGRLAKGAAVAFFLSAGAYNQYVRDLFLNGIPNDIVNAITGAAGGSVNAAAFDHVWNKAFAGGLAVWKNLGRFDFGLMFIIGVYWLAAAVATSFGFSGLAGFSHSARSLRGHRTTDRRHVPVPCDTFDLRAVDRRIAVHDLPTGLHRHPAGGADRCRERLACQHHQRRWGNPIAQIQVLFGAIILFIIASVIVVQLPGAATALAGGMHFQANALARATFGRSMALSARTAAGIRSLAASQGRAAQFRLTAGSVPGPSMSTTTKAGSS